MTKIRLQKRSGGVVGWVLGLTLLALIGYAIWTMIAGDDGDRPTSRQSPAAALAPPASR